MQFRRHLPKIFIALGFLSLILIVKYQNYIKDIWSFNSEKIQIYFDNFFYGTSPEVKRHRLISTVKKETELQMYVGEPFKSFSRSQWREFWNFIYGAFPKEKPARAGLPNRMRQLTEDEIATELVSRYPMPFGYFKSNHWRMFFDIVFGK